MGGRYDGGLKGSLSPEPKLAHPLLVPLGEMGGVAFELATTRRWAVCRPLGEVGLYQASQRFGDRLPAPLRFEPKKLLQIRLEVEVN